MRKTQPGVWALMLEHPLYGGFNYMHPYIGAKLGKTPILGTYRA